MTSVFKNNNSYFRDCELNLYCDNDPSAHTSAQITFSRVCCELRCPKGALLNPRPLPIAQRTSCEHVPNGIISNRAEERAHYGACQHRYVHAMIQVRLISYPADYGPRALRDPWP